VAVLTAGAEPDAHRAPWRSSQHRRRDEYQHEERRRGDQHAFRHQRRSALAAWQGGGYQLCRRSGTAREIQLLVASVYIDPSVGSLILQVLAAAVLSVATFVGSCRRAVRAFFSRLTRRPQ